MISNVRFNYTEILAGDSFIMTVEAAYPIVVEVYCFVTQPPPPKFIPCPDSGKHHILEPQSFEFRTSEYIFENSGYVEVKVIDADGDSDSYRIKINGLNKSMFIN